jgi:hypothetical protein
MVVPATIFGIPFIVVKNSFWEFYLLKMVLSRWWQSGYERWSGGQKSTPSHPSTQKRPKTKAGDLAVTQ